MKILRTLCVVCFFMITQNIWAERSQSIAVNDIVNPSTTIANITSASTFTFDVLHVYATDTSLSTSSNTVRALGLRLFFNNEVLEYIGTSFDSATKVYALDYQGDTQIQPIAENDLGTSDPSSSINNTDNDDNTDKQITTIWASDTIWAILQGQRLYTAEFKWRTTANRATTSINFAITTITNGFVFSASSLIIEGQGPYATTATLALGSSSTIIAGTNASFTINLSANNIPTNRASLSFVGANCSNTAPNTNGITIVNCPLTQATNTVIAAYLDGVIIMASQTIIVQAATLNQILLSVTPTIIRDDREATITLVATLIDEFNNIRIADNSSIAFKTSSTTILTFDGNTLESTTTNAINGIATLIFTATNTSVGTTTITASIGTVMSTDTITVEPGFNLDIDKVGGLTTIDSKLILLFITSNSSKTFLNTSAKIGGITGLDRVEIYNYLDKFSGDLNVENTDGLTTADSDLILLFITSNGNKNIFINTSTGLTQSGSSIYDTLNGYR